MIGYHVNMVFSALCQELRREFSAFENLFGSFLMESGTTVEWDKIKTLKEGEVSATNTWGPLY